MSKVDNINDGGDTCESLGINSVVYRILTERPPTPEEIRAAEMAAWGIKPMFIGLDIGGHAVPDSIDPSGSVFIGPDGVKYHIYIPPSSFPL